jgi:uncharacterized 2Fe-2S/4Fe-4S cluster protein (DUF4445 family)
LDESKACQTEAKYDKMPSYEKGRPMREKKITVTINPEGIRTEAKPGDLMSGIIQSAGIDLRSECGGKGTCGQCRIGVVSGDPGHLSEGETRLLARQGNEPGFRLACVFRPTGDVEIQVPGTSRAERPAGAAVTETGLVSNLDPVVSKIRIEAPDSSLSSSLSLQEVLARATGRKNLRIVLRTLRGFPGKSPNDAKGLTAVFYGQDDVIGLEPGDTSDSAYGIAVDVGTTTIAVELVDLITGKTVGRRMSLNPQAAYGADLLSRITRAVEDSADRERLRTAVLEILDELIRELIGGVSGHAAIYDCVIAGNTAMNHLLLGVPVDTLGFSPFHAAFQSLPPLEAGDVGLTSCPSARVHVVPNIKSFIGGDVAAGLSASEFDRRPGIWLFIDLGTNGEIVLKKGRRMFAASTAAGPAFEGMSISCGMMAVPGAVHRVEWREGRFLCETLGNGPAAGVCGTGLIDVLAVALENGLIGRDGRIARADKILPLGSGPVLTQTDLRELQLAVAAVKTGIRLLLRSAHVALDELDGILVAGAFGASMNIRNAMTLGLVPSIAPEKVIFIGNASLAGARKLLLQASERKRLGAFVGKIVHLSLGSGGVFQDVFVESLAFGPYRGETS